VSETWYSNTRKRLSHTFSDSLLNVLQIQVGSEMDIQILTSKEIQQSTKLSKIPKVMVKLSLCLTKHHAMKAYWGVEV
jgi:hypothetical protein